MKKLAFISCILIAFMLNGCSDIYTKRNVLPGDTPPSVNIEIEGESYDATLGSYCWNVSMEKSQCSDCVNTAGPLVLLKDKDPIQIKAGAEIKLKMDDIPQPNKEHLSLIDDDEIGIVINDSQFTAPDEKGIYFYNYGVWWTDKENESLSYGDAFYSFALEVQ